MTILDAIHDHNLFKPLFKSLDTWKSWLVVLRAEPSFALPMDDDDLKLFAHLTGRETAPVSQVQDCWLVIGRRGGKSFIVALIAVFLATFKTYGAYLGPGERGVFVTVATDRKQGASHHALCPRIDRTRRHAQGHGPQGKTQKALISTI